MTKPLSKFTQNSYLIFRLVLLAFALCLLPSVSSAIAPDSCEQTDSGERLKCKFGNIIKQQEESADKLSSMGNIPQDRTDKLKRQVGKTKNTHGKTEIGDFKQFTKKQKVQCDIVELSIADGGNGDDDGICEGNEICAEDNSDQIGNNDGVCSPKNGKKREMCLEICDDEAIRGNPKNFDDTPGSRGADMEQVLDDITDDYVELNGNLDEGVAVSSMTSSFSTLSSDDPCQAVMSSRPTQQQLDRSFMATYIAENLSEQFDNVCNYDAAGFNVAVACIVTDGIYIVAKGISDTISSANEGVDSETIDATLACVKTIQESSDDQAQQLDNIENKLSTVENKLDSALNKLTETIELLETPQGQRSNFNK